MNDGASRFSLLRRPSRRVAISFFAATLGIGSGVTAVACSSADPTTDSNLPNPVLPDGGTLTRADVLNAFVSCLTGQIDQFVADVTAFDAAATTYAATPADDAAATGAKNAWRTAMKSWQRIEPMQLGPLKPTGNPGAKSYAEDIYSWPLLGRCSIENGLVDKIYETGVSSVLAYARGLTASEYLLFYTGDDNACGAAAPINSAGKWTAIAPELHARKAGYLSAVTKDLLTRATSLRNEFAPSGGNFTSEYVTAGKGSKVYATEQMAFNAAADALFYLEYTVKDIKVGKPAGVAGCVGLATCPDDTESIYAGASKEHLRNNLMAARYFLFGCSDTGDGIGFDELLRGVGADATSAQLKVDLDAAVAALEAIPNEDLRVVILADPAPVRALYVAVKKVTDRLKTEFVSLLDLELPQRAEGDND